jgi:GNAT superfamily N-acetyltransferase
MRLLYLRSSQDDYVGEPTGPWHHVYDIHGTIYLSQEDGSETTIGTFSAAYVAGSVCFEDDYNLEDLFDVESQLFAIYDACFDAQRLQVRESVEDLLGEILSLETFVIRSIEIQPEFRGKGIGHAAIDRMIDTLGRGADLVALIAFPTQYNGVRDDSPEAVRDFEKLRSHYATMGFKRIGESDVMALSARHVRPSAPDPSDQIGLTSAPL